MGADATTALVMIGISVANEGQGDVVALSLSYGFHKLPLASYRHKACG